MADGRPGRKEREETNGQANGFNFSSALGAGIYLSLTKHLALNLGYRHSHVSNADIKKPNEGIDSDIGIAGLSFFF